MLDTDPQINLFLDDGVLGWLLLFQWHSPNVCSASMPLLTTLSKEQTQGN